jgi:peptidoglycan glycosyltransferase
VNGPVRKVAIACMVLFAALLVNANWLQVGKASDLKRKPQNSTRQITAKLDRERGAIVADKFSIAVSKPSNDAYKYQRSYPYNSLYAPITGYFTLFSASGLELADNDFLTGSDNRLFVSRLSDLVTGRKQRGGAVVTTIKPEAQFAAAQALGGRRGGVVAIDPRNGEILAMVTSPSYDPNPLASHDTKTATNAFNLLNADPAQPLLNRAAQQTYPPGSTFKVITAAAALSNGRTPDSRVASPNQLPLPKSTRSVGNFGGETCGDGRTSTLIDALTISCNTAFAQLGIDLGEDKLRSQAEAFGLNSTVPDFPLRQAKSVFPSPLDGAQTALSAIGQYDVRVTPLQMAMVAAAVGNHGQMMEPHIVKQLLGPDLKSISRTNPKVLGQPVTADVAAQLTTMMESVVERGTGTAAQIPGVNVAGKTGTAQHAEGKPPHAWFIGFAPAENPTVAVAVVVEDGGGELQATGGAVAAPIAQKVMTSVLGTGK